MLNKSLQKKISILATMAFIVLATTGITMTYAMDATVKHDCPFSGAGMGECMMMSSGAMETAIQHIGGFQSMFHAVGTNLFSILLLILVAASISLFFSSSGQSFVSQLNKLVLQLFTKIPPPVLIRYQRWLAIHSRNLIPDSIRVRSYSV